VSREKKKSKVGFSAPPHSLLSEDIDIMIIYLHVGRYLGILIIYVSSGYYPDNMGKRQLGTLKDSKFGLSSPLVLQAQPTGSIRETSMGDT
jgi:hypothetical protein